MSTQTKQHGGKQFSGFKPRIFLSVILAVFVTLMSVGLLVPDSISYSSWVSLFLEISILFPFVLVLDTVSFEGECDNIREKLRRTYILVIRGIIFAGFIVVVIPLMAQFLWIFEPDIGQHILSLVWFSIIIWGGIERLTNKAPVS